MIILVILAPPRLRFFSSKPHQYFLLLLSLFYSTHIVNANDMIDVSLGMQCNATALVACVKFNRDSWFVTFLSRFFDWRKFPAPKDFE